MSSARPLGLTEVSRGSREAVAKKVSISQPPSATQTSAECPGCHNIQTSFYCSACLSERVILQHADHVRLGNARQSARNRVEILLGLVEVVPKEDSSQGSATLPDPFVVESGSKKAGSRRSKQSQPLVGPHPGASTETRAARAIRSRLQDEIVLQAASAASLRKDNREKNRTIEKRRQELRRRSETLDTVLHYDRQEDKVKYLDSIALDLPSEDKLSRVKELVADLAEEGSQVAKEVAGERARLAKDAFALFDVRAPSTSLASARALSLRRSFAVHATSSTPRALERYAKGAFAIDPDPVKAKEESGLRHGNSKAETVSVNDWTILGLTLPVPSEMKRFERAEINGAISHTVQLLQLVTTYLGIALPFVVSVQGDMPLIRPNILWGAGAKETLNLSASGHSALSGPPSLPPMATMGASMMSSLGASTLSTIESFVQLPNGKNFPWARNAADTSNKRATKPQQQPNNNTSTVSKQPAAEDAASVGAKRFCSALTMLSYDAAYLADLQGVKVTLDVAAGSVLRLLSKALQSPELGRRSHLAAHAKSNIPHLQFSSIDYAQLLQAHDYGASPKTLSGVLTIKSPAKTAIMEGSYVDARKAAESILDLRGQKDDSISSSSRYAPASAGEQMSSLAAKRVPSTPLPSMQSGRKALEQSRKKGSSAEPRPNPPHTLEFLRARGQRERQPNEKEKRDVTRSDTDAKMKLPPVPAAAATVSKATSPATGGTIIFNGKEIRGKFRTQTTKERLKAEDDGWHVL